MKIWQGEQRSPEWHSDFRAKGVGASESAKVLGLSKYGNAIDVFNDKTGRAFPFAPNAAMQRGIDTEDEIRARAEDLLCEAFTPMCAEHDDHPFLKASFDGVSSDKTAIIEIKNSKIRGLFNAVMADDIETLKNSYPDYTTQVQHQLAVNTDAKLCYFVVFQDGQLAFTRIERDEDFIQNTLIPGIKSFWEDYVVPDVCPPPAEGAHIVVDDLQAISTAAQMQDILAEEKVLKKRKEALRTLLLSYGDDGNFIVGKLRMTRTSRTTVDYKKACEDSGIDTTKYAKEGIGYYTIKEMK